MKQYRLTAWPDLGAPFDRISYRRILTDMSHRHVTLAQLTCSSGLRRREVRSFVNMLCHRGVIGERDAERPASIFRSLRSLRPLRGWLRRSRHRRAV